MDKLKILLVEDSDLDAELILARLRAETIPADTVRVHTRDAMDDALACHAFDLILSDYSLPTFDGPTAFELARQRCPDVPFIFVSGMLGEEIAIDILKRGATDYVLKQRLDRLGTAIRQAIAQRRERAARERAQAELRAAKEAAEAANKSKDRFLAVLSHELRTPLSPILATVQALELDETLPADVRHAVDVIKRNAELEARLIDDLLDLTRVSRGKLQVHLAPVDAHRVAERAVEIVRSEVGGHRHRLLVDLRATAPTVNADSARLQQILWNLLKNAVKFTPDGGEITLRSYDGEGGGTLILEVADTGIGISPEVMPRIFDAFEQGGNDVGRTFGGMGLGLAIARSLAELHGATLQVFSEGVGRGSTFRLTIEKTAAPDARNADAPGGVANKSARGRKLRILLVEDHADTARAMVWLLRRNGHEVMLANSVNAGIAQARQTKFDLLISDIGLPDGTGWDLIRQMPQDAMPIPAIALTGFGMEHDVARSREAGFQEHLTKPVNFQQLEAAILALSGV